MCRLTVGILSAAALFACKSDDASGLASEGSIAARAPSQPPTPHRAVQFQTDDGRSLAGTLHLAKDAQAPLLVLIHQFRGDRSEWAPLADRMAKSDKRYHILNFDLRSHGESALIADKGERLLGTPRKGLQLTREAITSDDAPLLIEDVHAAIRHGLEQTGSKARAVVLVGSSLGAALAARVAREQARVSAVALVSPTATILHRDIIRPFADVRNLPSFLALAENDIVSIEPIRVLRAMAQGAATVKKYAGQGHGAYGLAKQNAPLFEDLEAWLLRVFAESPRPRDPAPATSTTPFAEPAR